MKKFLIIVLVLVLLGIGGYVLLGKDDTPEEEASTVTPTQTTLPSPSEEDESTPAVASATITYTDQGFSPSTITVKAGETVMVKNDSAISLQFSSDDHPTHTHDTELNQETIDPGESQTFTVTKKGTWGYHNHLQDSDTGTIVVE